MNFLKFTKKDYIYSILLFLIGIFSRFPLIEKMQSHWDGSLFSIAVVKYSIVDNTPPRPGHPLYIAFGKFFHFFVSDPHLAILLVSVLFSGLSAIAFFILGKAIFNRSVGIISALIFLSGSTFYYFGLTPYSFVILPFYWSLLAALSYLYIFKKKKTAVFIGIVYAFGLGVRPQEILFITPLALYVFYFMDKKDKIKSLISFSLTMAIWLIPLLADEGWLRYFIVASSHPPPYTVGFKQQDLELILKDYFLSLGIAGVILPLFLFLNRSKLMKNKGLFIFFLVWIMPSAIYNFFIISVHAGYQMDYLIALVLLSSLAIHSMFKSHKKALYLVVSIIVISNLLMFFWDRDPNYIKPYRPTSFHYSDIRKNDLKMSSKVDYIKSVYDPHSTLIITVSTLWSPYMYHLKEFHQYSIEALFTENPAFKNQRRDSYMWKVHEYSTNDHVIKVPKYIHKILLVDDELNIRLINLKSKKISLPGNSSIIEIDVNFGDKIKYGYQYLKKN